MKGILFGAIIAVTLLGCATHQAFIEPTPASTDELATWHFSTTEDNKLTDCGASNVYEINVTMTPQGEWDSTIKIRAVDPHRYRAYWRNKITATLHLEDGNALAFVLMSDSMKAHTRKTFTTSGQQPAAVDVFDQVKRAQLSVEHECEGLKIAP
ncbi:MAG: hypothetical protein AAF465_13710 [Pseudomonadota bacterium]